MTTPRTALPRLGPWAPSCAEPRTVTITYHDGRSEETTAEELHRRFGAQVVEPSRRLS